MNSGYYLAQPKFEPSFKFDMINFLAGPYASHEAAQQMLAPFSSWFASQYPGERAAIVVIGIIAPVLPIGRFNSMNYEAPPFRIGYKPT